MKMCQRCLRGAACWALVAVAALAIVGAGPADAARVTVRVEGTNRTLLRPTTAYTTSRFVAQRSGCEFPDLLCTPCPGRSALGAIDSATRGRWTARFDDEDDYELERILSETLGPGQGQWIMYLNNALVTQPPCWQGLEKRDSLLVFAQTEGILLPLALRAPASVRDHAFVVRAVKYTHSGRGVPVRGALVTGGARPVHTGPGGRALVKPGGRRHLRLRATKRGLVRSTWASISVRRSTR